MLRTREYEVSTDSYHWFTGSETVKYHAWRNHNSPIWQLKCHLEYHLHIAIKLRLNQYKGSSSCTFNKPVNWLEKLQATTIHPLNNQLGHQSGCNLVVNNSINGHIWPTGQSISIFPNWVFWNPNTQIGYCTSITYFDCAVAKSCYTIWVITGFRRQVHKGTPCSWGFYLQSNHSNI